MSGSIRELVDGWFEERAASKAACGLFANLPQSATGSTSLPLKTRAVTATIDCDLGIAETVEVLTYQSQDDCSASFRFPLPPKAAVHKFEAVVGDISIRTQTKKKARAEVEFQTAVQQGHTAVLAKQNSTDIYSIELGNLPANQVCVIKIGYLRLLDKVSSTLQFLHTATWVPPYQGGQHPRLSGESSDSATPAFVDKVAYRLSYRVSCTSQTAIRSVTCGDLAVILDGPHGKTVSLDAEVADAGKDFEVMVELEDGPLGSRLQRQVCHRAGEDKTLLLATFVPRLPSEPAAPAPLREVWLVVDCSGSMMGAPINQAREAALFFIKDMPLNAGVHFNVVAFGTHYQFLYPEARLYDGSTNAEAVRWVTNGLHDMGGTEIYACLKAVNDVKVPQGYTRQIIFLTDGGVSPSEETHVLSLFKNLAAPRVFSLGIGHGVHRGLLVDLAEASNGVTQFAAEDKGILRSCNALKRFAMAPTLLHKARLTCRNAIMHLVPAVLPAVLFPDQPITVLAEVTAAQEGATLELSAQLMGAEGGWSEQLHLSRAEPVEGDMLPVLHAMGYVNALLSGRSSLHVGPDGAVRSPAPRQDLVEEEVVRVAVAENLVTPLTASVGVMLQANPLDPAKVRRVDVPIQVPQGRKLWATVDARDGLHQQRTSFRSNVSSQAMPAPQFLSALYCSGAAPLGSAPGNPPPIPTMQPASAFAGMRSVPFGASPSGMAFTAFAAPAAFPSSYYESSLGGVSNVMPSTSLFGAACQQQQGVQNFCSSVPCGKRAGTMLHVEQKTPRFATAQAGAQARASAAEENEKDDPMDGAQRSQAQQAALPPSDVLQQLNSLRNAEGFWPASGTLMAMLARGSSSSATALLSARPQDVGEDEWSTVVVLAYLGKHLGGEQAVWEGMAEKAQQWLQMRWPATARSVAATIIAVMKLLDTNPCAETLDLTKGGVDNDLLDTDFPMEAVDLTTGEVGNV